MQKLYHFPTNINFQSMLVDKNNKVLAIGNPVLNPKVLDLYQSIILGQGEDQGHITTLTGAWCLLLGKPLYNETPVLDKDQ